MQINLCMFVNSCIFWQTMDGFIICMRFCVFFCNCFVSEMIVNFILGEFGNNGVNETLLSYADQAQEMADTLVNEQTLINKRQQSLEDIRAEIHSRAPIHNNNLTTLQHVTPGI